MYIFESIDDSPVSVHDAVPISVPMNERDMDHFVPQSSALADRRKRIPIRRHLWISLQVSRCRAHRDRCLFAMDRSMVVHQSIKGTRQNTIDASSRSADVEVMPLTDGPVLLGSQHQRRRGACRDSSGKGGDHVRKDKDTESDEDHRHDRHGGVGYCIDIACK